MSTDITNPESYSLRDTLLLSQLLHINHIGDYSKLESTHEDKLREIIDQFKHHKAIRIQKKILKLDSIDQLKELYENLLNFYKVSNTEQLANQVYYRRIEVLEREIESKKQEFQTVLKEEEEVCFGREKHKN